MKKKRIIYSDLSKKQLESLKDYYIEKKVNCMTNEELKEFVKEIITHQIQDTIGKEEEMEAWNEMSNFLGEQFEIIIQEIQQKYTPNEDISNVEEDPQKYRLELLEKNNIDSNKKDMWDD